MTDTSPHVLVTENDDAGREVAEDSNNQEESVEDSEGNQSLQIDLECAWNRREICFLICKKKSKV